MSASSLFASQHWGGENQAQSHVCVFSLHIEKVASPWFFHQKAHKSCVSCRFHTPGVAVLLFTSCSPRWVSKIKLQRLRSGVLTAKPVGYQPASP